MPILSHIDIAKKWLSKQRNFWEILESFRTFQDPVEAPSPTTRDFGLTTGLQKPIAFLRGSGVRGPVTKDGDLKPSKSG